MKKMFLPNAQNDAIFTVIGSPISLISAAFIAAAAGVLLFFLLRRR